VTLAQDIQDDGFHEIQLNGKQLVFLFMAVTVVSVVIFLCGVLVGRGVRAERAATEVAAGSPVADVPVPTPSGQPATSAPAPAGSDPTAAAPPPPAADDLTYFDRLEKEKAPAEHLKAPVAESTTRNEKKNKTPAPATSGTAGSVPEPAGPGYAVQIAALNVRNEAEAIAKRLTSKGYTAYVLSPPSGTPAVYRVRVGKFPTRREAETIAARLKKEEQFNPWITR
jgi:DedD protein